MVVDLVERYVHQVGRYLPPNERAEVESELRSLIQDQLDDRYGGMASKDEIASVLVEFGHPHEMAASYSRDRYLVGPDLYPIMIMVLKHVWVIVPTVVIFLNLFAALTSERQVAWIGFVAETGFAVLQAAFGFSGVAVLLFGFIERVRPHLDDKDLAFDPLGLPQVDDPRSVDRFEAVSGIVVGMMFTLLFCYWLVVGGLTLRFNLSDPGEVTPISTAWLVLLIVVVGAQAILHGWVLWRRRWNAGLWVLQTALEVLGVICLYFAVLVPGFARIVADNPQYTAILGSAPETIGVGLGLLSLVSKAPRLLRLWSDRNSRPLSLSTKTGV